MATVAAYHAALLAPRPPKARDKIPALRMMPNSTKATAAE